MKREKGFTLIELLAVIVILAIIALISTPIIIGVIEKARKGAFEDSAYGVLDAGKIYFMGKLADNNRFAGATFTFPDGGDIKISGEKPAGGTLSIDSSGNQAMALYDKDKKWCATKNYNEEKITVKDYVEEECEIAPPSTPEKCFIFDVGRKTIVNYQLDDKDCGKDVVIPSTIEGVPVENIGFEAFSYKIGYINSVVFPTTLVTIGNDAFESQPLCIGDFSNLTSLKSIGSYAFYRSLIGDVEGKDCDKIILPSSIEKLDSHAFTYGCGGNLTVKFKIDHFTLEQSKTLAFGLSYGEEGSWETKDGFHSVLYKNDGPC